MTSRCKVRSELIKVAAQPQDAVSYLSWELKYVLFRDSYSEDLRGGDRRVVVDGKTYYALTQCEFFITMAGVIADRNQVAKNKHYRDVIQKTRMARSMINVWTPLVPVTPHNGCMQVRTRTVAPHDGPRQQRLRAQPA